MSAEEILDELYSASRFHECHGCDFSDEDVQNVLENIACGMSFDDAIEDVLTNIDNVL